MSAVPLMPPLRVLLPIEDVILLIAPAMAVCSLVAWWAGGRFVVVLLWAAVAGWMMLVPPTSPTPYFERLERGYALLLAASFGVVSLLSPARPFLTRALSSVVIALALGIGVVRIAGGSGSQIAAEVAATVQLRNRESISMFEEQTRDASWFRDATRGLATEVPRQLETLAQKSVLIFPALLALESIAALALAWSLFHRLSRTRIGDPLLPLREFRFDDQLVWGLLVGLTLVAIPSFDELANFGWMLVVFFSGLYVVRGLGVMAWVLQARQRWISFVVVALMLAITPYSVAALLGLGVGDTWADWRRRPHPST